MNNREDLDMNIADCIMEKPVGFKIGRRQFYLYYPTLGKSYLLSRLIKTLGVNMKMLSINPYFESFRLASCKKDTVCRILAYHSLSKKRDIQDEIKVKSRTKLFQEKLDIDEIAQLLIIAFTLENVSSYITYLGIDKEQERRNQVMKIKNISGNLSFCGKSTYGTLIDWACQRYGWSMEYVVWGISYVNLQMLMADAVTSVYVSEEERKKLGISDSEDIINADDPQNRDLIRKMLS